MLDNKIAHVNNALKDYTRPSQLLPNQSVSNGKNENDTKTLDFEYVSIDNSGDSTFRQYVPMSSKWKKGR